MCYRFDASDGFSQESTRLSLNLHCDGRNEAVAERGHKDKGSLQVLGEQKNISVNKVRLSRKQILKE